MVRWPTGGTPWGPWPFFGILPSHTGWVSALHYPANHCPHGLLMFASSRKRRVRNSEWWERMVKNGSPLLEWLRPVVLPPHWIASSLWGWLQGVEMWVPNSPNLNGFKRERGDDMIQLLHTIATIRWQSVTRFHDTRSAWDSRVHNAKLSGFDSEIHKYTMLVLRQELHIYIYVYIYIYNSTTSWFWVADQRRSGEFGYSTWQANRLIIML